MLKKGTCIAIVALLLVGLVRLGFAQSADGDGGSLESKKSISAVKEVNIYPNPASDFLQININDDSLDGLTFQVVNLIGNRMEFMLQRVDETSYRIPVDHLPSGYYVVILSDPQANFQKALRFKKQ